MVDRSPRAVPTVRTSVDILDRDVDVPPTSLADFEIVKILASNEGISSCRAHLRGQFGFHKRVLLKVADQPFDAAPETNVRLREEARIGMRLAHPNLVQIIDLGRDEGRTFLVREWVDGQGLRALLRRCWSEGGALAPAAALRVGVGAARALVYLHGIQAPWAPRGISHRVITPSNILLSLYGEVRLGNLSLADPSARFDSEARAVEGGHPAFCAPEVIEGARAGHPADIFSLGAVLFEALEGPSAFEGDPRSDWLRFRPELQLQDAIRDSSLAPPLRNLLSAATAPVPDARPVAAELRDGLREWLMAEHASDGEDELRAALAA